MLGIQMKFPAGNTIAMTRTVPLGATTDNRLFIHLCSIPSAWLLASLQMALYAVGGLYSSQLSCIPVFCLLAAHNQYLQFFVQHIQVIRQTTFQSTKMLI